ncbi:hypothetical protein T261_8536 [Streptomyces lydicus]|nr:hypothetical protein T261_8536 [Streptomyces lydicus]
MSRREQPCVGRAGAAEPDPSLLMSYPLMSYPHMTVPR